jgi:hypothetical protein
MYREPFYTKVVFLCKIGLDTNLNSAIASLKFTRPDIRPTFVSSSVFQHSASGVENVSRTECFLFGAKAENKKCIDNLLRFKL